VSDLIIPPLLFSGRISSLGQAYEILTNSPREQIPLRALAQKLLEPYHQPVDGPVSINDPDVMFKAPSFPRLGDDNTRAYYKRSLAVRPDQYDVADRGKTSLSGEKRMFAFDFDRFGHDELVICWMTMLMMSNRALGPCRLHPELPPSHSEEQGHLPYVQPWQQYVCWDRLNR
jgi:hypothetical protein